jgi:hypothetical protein
MGVSINYYVDKNLYYKTDIPHTITLITTEYLYKNELLVHLLIGRSLVININNLIQQESQKDRVFGKEQFLFKKNYSNESPKPITRSTFASKLNQLDISQTMKEQEILEEYRYNDKNGKPDIVQIVISVKDDDITAIIDFKDAEQYGNFVEPVWLIRPTK